MAVSPPKAIWTVSFRGLPFPVHRKNVLAEAHIASSRTRVRTVLRRRRSEISEPCTPAWTTSGVSRERLAQSVQAQQLCGVTGLS